MIHNGVDPIRFSPEHLVKCRASLRQAMGINDKVVMLFAAHNFRLKGLETVIRAMGRMRERRLHLVVTGRESSEKWLRLAKRFGIAEQISFCGFVPEIEPYYAVADAFVQPTFYDPCSLVALEAAACGLPVVTSRFNGAAELFFHAKNGWIVQNPQDDRELSQYLLALLDDGKRQQMGAAARELALRSTADECFERIFQLYLTIPNGRCHRDHQVECRFD